MFKNFSNSPELSILKLLKAKLANLLYKYDKNIVIF